MNIILSDLGLIFPEINVQLNAATLKNVCMKYISIENTIEISTQVGLLMSDSVLLLILYPYSFSL